MRGGACGRAWLRSGGGALGGGACGGRGSMREAGSGEAGPGRACRAGVPVGVLQHRLRLPGELDRACLARGLPTTTRGAGTCGVQERVCAERLPRGARIPPVTPGGAGRGPQSGVHGGGRGRWKRPGLGEPGRLRTRGPLSAAPQAPTPSSPQTGMALRGPSHPFSRRPASFSPPGSESHPQPCGWAPALRRAAPSRSLGWCPDGHGAVTFWFIRRHTIGALIPFKSTFCLVSFCNDFAISFSREQREGSLSPSSTGGQEAHGGAVS